MAFKGKVRGKLHKSVSGLVADIEAGTRKAVVDSTLLLDETAKKLIAKRSSGEKQTRYSPKREVVASKPGDAPNTDTGRAIQSIFFDIKDEGLRGIVGTKLRYLIGLEFGTKHVAARPWLSTALKLVKKDMAKEFNVRFTKAVRRGSK